LKSIPGKLGAAHLRTLGALICVLLTAGYVHARVHRSQDWADTQFDKAESQHDTLEARAEASRTRHEYDTVVASYRLVVLEAPTSTKADDSAFEVAEITAEMGRHFKDDSALNSALREYKFLRREYPGSKHRIAALLAIGKIYKNDLGDDADGRDALQELLRHYPRSQYAEQARAALGSRNPQSSKNVEAAKTSAKPYPAAAKTEDSPDPALVRDDDSAASGDPSGKVASVNALHYASSHDYTRVTVDLDQNVQFQSQRIGNPHRIFFDLKNTQLSSELTDKSFDVDDGLVEKIRVAQYRPGSARVVIETDDRASYQAYLASNPPRLIIDVRNGDGRNGSSASAQTQIPGCATVDARSSARIGVGGTGVPARATADAPCAPTPDPTASSAPPATAAAVKKVIVEAGGQDSEDNPDPAPSKANPKSAQSDSASSPVGARATSSLAKYSHEAQPTADGDRSLIRALGLKIGKIVIDPGHGGHDTGTIGPNGLLEKDLVLDVSRRLGKLLEVRLGAEVVFTRRDDTFIPLETRTVIANQEQADLFVSVHANSSHDPDARGVETYYLNFTSSPEALEVAARENAASDQDIHQLQDLVKKIALKEKIEESREFASDVQQSLHSGLAAKTSGIRDRGVKKAPFVVLIGANMPSILAEISFISNPGDEKRLQSPDYRQRIAESLYRGISRYVNGLGGVKVASKVEKASAE
jgi:N-acetylmuramoyl-L-alanine amidase